MFFFNCIAVNDNKTTNLFKAFRFVTPIDFCWCQLRFDFRKERAFKCKYFSAYQLRTKEKMVHFLGSKNVWYVYWIAITLNLKQEPVNCKKPISSVARHLVWNVTGFLYLHLIRLTLLLCLIIYIAIPLLTIIILIIAIPKSKINLQ